MNSDNFDLPTKLDLLEILKTHFKKKEIYVFIGNLLITLNPFENQNWFSDSVAQSYRNNESSKPHIYLIGKFRNL